MSVQKLWYINNEDGEAVGPFPTKVIIERLILERLEPDVLLSLDKDVWYPAKKIPEA